MKTLLLIDDDKFTLEHWSKLIEKMGAKVVTASTGREGVTLYKEIKPDFVFLDMVLPDMNGKMVLDSIMAVEHRAKVYVVTGSEEIYTKEEMIKAGAEDFISKPMIYDEVIQIVKNISAG